MSKCYTCKIHKEMPDMACCAWYMDNVVCGDKTTEECTEYIPCDKEFAERLKSKFTHSGKSTKYGEFTWDDVTSYEIDNLVKEMESEK